LNEKLQWLKLNYRDPLLKICADKVSARAFVAEKVGAKHLVPSIAIYDSVDQIDFDALPASFVLKASHGSGWNIICRDKKRLDVAVTRRKLARWHSQNFYEIGREWAYDALTPRILAEEFINGPDGDSPWDYKVFCFHGVARFIQVDYARFSDHTRALYDLHWNQLPCALEYPRRVQPSARPVALPELLRVAETLSIGFPFVRVDLYALGMRVLFGEMTFYPGKGVERFYPTSWDREFGAWLDVDSVRQEAYRTRLQGSN
jgi:hypothetical protein